MQSYQGVVMSFKSFSIVHGTLPKNASNNKPSDTKDIKTDTPEPKALDAKVSSSHHPAKCNGMS